MSDQSPADAPSYGWRNVLAMTVFAVSTVSIIGLTVIGLVPGLMDITSRKELYDKVFAALVPLYGTWVGTVLTFYFTRENFEAANRSLQQVVRQLTPDDRLRSIPVKSAMIPRDKMVVETLGPGGPAAVTFTRLQAILAIPHTRIPVLNTGGSPNCVVHESMIYKYMSQHSAGGAFDPATHTLADLLADVDIGPKIRLFALVGPDCTLADAKAAMEKLAGCQDVFVTATALPTGPVVGWLTNIEITKNLKTPTGS